MKISGGIFGKQLKICDITLLMSYFLLWISAITLEASTISNGVYAFCNFSFLKYFIHAQKVKQRNCSSKIF